MTEHRRVIEALLTDEPLEVIDVTDSQVQPDAAESGELTRQVVLEARIGDKPR